MSDKKLNKIINKTFISMLDLIERDYNLDKQKFEDFEMYLKSLRAQKCSTCQYGNYDAMQGYVCVNGESDHCTEFMNEHDTCDNWSKKHD